MLILHIAGKNPKLILIIYVQYLLYCFVVCLFSLSRHSPLERPQRRITQRQRQQSSYPTVSDISSTLSKQKGKKSEQLPKTQCSPNSLSSSGSESSLPPISKQPQKESSLTASYTNSVTKESSSKDNRLSRFCHACGSRFTLTQAKFCMACGSKRVVF